MAALYVKILASNVPRDLHHGDAGDNGKVYSILNTFANMTKVWTNMYNKVLHLVSFISLNALISTPLALEAVSG